MRRVRRVASALTSAAWTSLLLIGLPAGLIRLVGWPFPDHLPTHEECAAWVQQPLTRGSVIGAAAVAAWLMWAAFLAVLLINAYRRAARLLRCLPDIRLPGPLQGLSAAILGTVAVSTAAGAASTPVAAYAAVAAVDTAQPLPPGGSTCSDPAAPAAMASLPVPRSVDQPAGQPQRTGTPPTSVRSSATVAAGPAGDIAQAGADRRTRHTQQTTLMATTPTHTYTVHRDDNLSHIAADWLGDADRWPEIYHLNRGRHFADVGGTLTNPNLIYPGWVLTLPNDATAPDGNPPAVVPSPVQPAADPAPSPPAPAPPSQPAPPSRPATPGSSASASALPSPSASAAASASPSAPASAVPSPSRSASPAPLPVGSGASPNGTDRPAPPVTRDVGVRLPGGWVPIPLAAALIAAAALVWLRRRHRYVPGKLAGPVLSDPDLQPLPPAVTVLRRGVRRDTPDLLPPTPGPVPEADPSRGAEVTRPPATPPSVPEVAVAEELPPIGPSGLDLAGLGSPLSPGGLGLVGDGAYAVARAMLVATLSSGSPHDPDARGQVVIPVDALTTLLGVDAVNLNPTPRLTVTANLGESLTRLEELLIERRRTLQDEDADDLESMRAADPMHPPMPPVLLLAEVPGPEARARLTTTLHLGTPLQINAVLLGDWPRGDTLDVDTEGYTDSDTTDRLAVLDTITTLQLLQMLAEAHTGQPAAQPVPEPTAPSTTDSGDPTDVPHDAPADLDRSDLAVPVLEPPTPPDADQTAAPRSAPDAPDRSSAPAQAGRPRVPIRVLGRPALVTTSPPKQELRRRALELLVYLAVHRGGANLADIKEAFWPDASNRRAGERLQTEVGDLRGRIRDAYHAITTNDTGKDQDNGEQVQPVINTGGRYHLNPDLLDIDWWTVQDALAAATTDTAHRAEHLRRAVDAFGGPLADGCGYDWMPDVEEHVRRQGIIAYTQLAQLVADTDPGEAVRLLDQATVLDPINEELARSAMRAHARLHNADAVRAQLHRIRTALDAIDLELDEQTTTLAADLLRQITAPSTKQPPPRDEPPQP
jgi:DNA-binding SARP family transcriptional activator